MIRSPSFVHASMMANKTGNGTTTPTMSSTFVELLCHSMHGFLQHRSFSLVTPPSVLLHALVKLHGPPMTRLTAMRVTPTQVVRSKPSDTFQLSFATSKDPFLYYSAPSKHTTMKFSSTILLAGALGSVSAFAPASKSAFLPKKSLGTVRMNLLAFCASIL